MQVKFIKNNYLIGINMIITKFYTIKFDFFVFFSPMILTKQCVIRPAFPLDCQQRPAVRLYIPFRSAPTDRWIRWRFRPKRRLRPVYLVPLVKSITYLMAKWCVRWPFQCQPNTSTRAVKAVLRSGISTQNNPFHNWIVW